MSGAMSTDPKLDSVSGSDSKEVTALPAKNVNSPIIKECLINFECKVIHKNDLIPSEIAPEIIPEFYPKGDLPSCFAGIDSNLQVEDILDELI